MTLTNLTDLTDHTILSSLETKFNQFAIDPLGAFKAIDFQTVAFVGVSILFVVFLVDLIAYCLAVYRGTENEFEPYSRSLAVMAADAWDNREENEISNYYDPYVRSRSMQSVTPILDSISKSIKQWQ